MVRNGVQNGSRCAQLCVLLIAFSCSHTTPYYRADLVPLVEPELDTAEISHRVILIGDAGNPLEEEPVLRTLGHWAGILPQQTTVVFLGDNIYENGMPAAAAAGRREGERRLVAQLGPVAAAGARALFIPGNHDWGPGGERGLAAIVRQQEFIDRELGHREGFLPRDGCPGPHAVDLPSAGHADATRLIAIDTNWWFAAEEIPPSCGNNSRGAVLAELGRLAGEPGPARVILLAHHPLKSHGVHGGFFDWKDHLFPLTRVRRWLWLPTPLIGSLYPIARGSLIVSPQDIRSSDYAAMIDDLSRALRSHRPLIFASGHEHSLQVMTGGDAARYAVVSGLGSSRKASAVSHGSDTLFAHLKPGFVVIDVTVSGDVLLRVVEPHEEEPVFAKWL